MNTPSANNYKRIIIICLYTFLFFSCRKKTSTPPPPVNPPAEPVAAIFKVNGTSITNAVTNQEFIPKGINVNGPYWPWPRPTLPDVNLIADAWKFNMVRLNVWQDFSSWNSHNSDMDAIIRAFTDKKVVVMIEEHEFGGKYPTTAELPAFANWWRALANKYKTNEYVWFNIMNEPGQGATAPQEWLTSHEEVIKAIRGAGAPNIIVCDEHGFGQANGFSNAAGSGVLTYGQQLTSKYKNIIFSLHMYTEWSYGEQRLASYIDAVKAKNLSLVIGEYGVGKTYSEEITSFTLKQCLQKKVGRIGWHWDGTTSVHDLVTTGDGGGYLINNTSGVKPTNLSFSGNLIWMDNYGTLTATDPAFNHSNVLVYNGNFDEGIPADNSNLEHEWITFGTPVKIDQAPGNVKQGVSACRVTSGAAGGCALPVYLKPGKTYRITAWGKNSAVSATPSTILFKYKTSYGGAEVSTGTLSFTTDSYEQKSTTFTLPSSMAEAAIVVYKGNAGISFWCDDIVIVEQ